MTKIEGFTPGPWEVTDDPGAGIQIHGRVDLGREKQGHDEHTPTGPVLRMLYEVSVRPELRVRDDGTVTAMIAYETWRQFPTVNFQKMQRANATLIAQAPTLYAENERLRARVEELARAAIRYDEAIHSCANSPAKMSSFCTAQGDDLDALYSDWVTKARAALNDGGGS